MEHTVTLRRLCSQRTGDDIITGHVDSLVDIAIRAYRRRGWTGRYSKPTAEKKSEGWVFSSTVNFTKKKNSSIEEEQFKDIIKRLAESAEASRFNKFPWRVFIGDKLHDASGQVRQIDEIGAMPTEVVVKPVDVKDYYDRLSLEPKEHYNHLFGLDDQIGIVRSALEEAVRSEFNNRYNVVLNGAPGCGKTDLMRSTAKMLGAENEAYIHLDATSATAAGVAKILLESDYIPPVLFVEEIEKASEDDLKWLLGVTDIRAEIRRTNFRIGNKAKKVKLLCIASVNNMALFGKIAAGALKSRFPWDVHCPRPNREIMQKILEREILKNKGRIEWIKPTLDYADSEGITDPRKVVPIMLCGKDRLLDGSYQKMLQRIKMPIEAKETS